MRFLAFFLFVPLFCLAQDFGPATQLVTQSGNIVSYSVRGFRSAEWPNDEETYLCWTTGNDTSYSVYVQQIGPSEMPPLEVSRDSLLKSECRVSLLGMDSLRVWWLEKDEELWRLSYRDVSSDSVLPKGIAADNLAGPVKLTANDQCVAWLADSAITYWAFSVAQEIPTLLDMEEKLIDLDISRDWMLPSIQILALQQIGDQQKVLLLDGGISEDQLWLIHDTEPVASLANPRFGYEMTTCWQVKTDSVWQIVYGWFEGGEDTTTNHSANYRNPANYMYPQVTKNTTGATPFFVAFDSDSLPDNREVWIRAHDVRTGEPYLQNISNGPGNDHHPQIAYLKSDDKTQIGLFWLKETDGRNEIWRSYADYVPDYGAIVERDRIPAAVTLLQNFPNPFNGETIVRYHLNRSGKVKILLYNSRGRLIRTLFSGIKPAGDQRLQVNLQGLASGVYFLRARTAGASGAYLKLILLK